MSDFVRICFHLDRVLGGKYAGRQITFTDGDTIMVNGKPAKRPGFEAVRDGETVLGFIRIEDGGPRPSDDELDAAMAEAARLAGAVVDEATTDSA